MKDLELGRIGMITPRHAEITEQKLREEGQIEPDESDNRGHLAEELRVKPARNFRPPVM